MALSQEQTQRTMGKSLIRSTSTVSMMTMISRIMGFIRDMVVAQVFGVNAASDAFFVVFKIPNFLRRLFAEGAFAQAFVPVLSEYMEQKSREQVREFIAAMSGTLGLALLIVCVIAVVFAPAMVWIFAPGFGHGDSIRFDLACQMLRITFPYLLFISLTAFAGAVQNTQGRFAIPAFTPVILNICMIAAAFLLAPLFHVPIKGLAWGVFFAGIAQYLFQLPFLWRLQLLTWPKLALKDPGVRRVLKLMVPALFGVSVGQISLLLDTVFASFLKVGSVTWLYYSDRLTSLPLGVFGVAIATVILPNLSRKNANNAVEDSSKTIDWALRSVLILGVPALVGFFALGGPLLSTLLLHGHFHAFDVQMTLRSLLAFALGIPSFMLVKVLAAGFYAHQNIRRPVRIAVIAVSCNILLNACLVWSMGHAGLALSTSIASIINASLLYIGLRRFGYYHPLAGWRKFFIQLLVANVVMGLAVWFAAGPLAKWELWPDYQRIIHLALLMGVALFLYFATLRVMGVRLKDFKGHR